MGERYGCGRMGADALPTWQAAPPPPQAHPQLASGHRYSPLCLAAVIDCAWRGLWARTGSGGPVGGSHDQAASPLAQPGPTSSFLFYRASFALPQVLAVHTRSVEVQGAGRGPLHSKDELPGGPGGGQEGGRGGQPRLARLPARPRWPSRPPLSAGIICNSSAPSFSPGGGGAGGSPIDPGKAPCAFCGARPTCAVGFTTPVHARFGKKMHPCFRCQCGGSHQRGQMPAVRDPYAQMRVTVERDGQRTAGFRRCSCMHHAAGSSRSAGPHRLTGSGGRVPSSRACAGRPGPDSQQHAADPEHSR